MNADTCLVLLNLTPHLQQFPIGKNREKTLDSGSLI